ncbi:MAG: PKD domain-containing protein, partial [Verrucomicrobiaceae bacterium]
MQRVVTSVTRSRVYPGIWLKAMGSVVCGYPAACAAFFSAFSTADAGTLPPVTLAWNKNPERNVSNYELRYGTAAGDYSYKIYTEDPTATVTGLQDNTTYFFVVVARNHAGKASPNSQEITYRKDVRVVQPPNGKIVSPAANVSITVGDSVDFSGSGKDPNGSSLTYRWNFGSGSGVSAVGGKNPGTRRFTIPGTYKVTLDVTNKLGKSDTTPATRVITVKAPAHEVLARKGWKLKYVNSQDAVNYPARYAFDDNPGTFWHTEWGKPGLPPPPHEIQIDLGKKRSINGFQYLPRQDGFVVGNIGSYRFYVSADGKKWGKAVATGTFENSSMLKSVFFKAKTGRYIRMVSVTEVHGYNDSAIAELQILQAVAKKKKVKKSAAATLAA